MIAEHSENYGIRYNPPTVARFEKVSFERYAQAIRDVLSSTVTDEQLKQWYDNIQLPTRATRDSAGYDFTAPFDIRLCKGIIIPTGLRCWIRNDYVLQIYPRSGLGFTYGVRLKNTVGIIDADYYNAANEGHIMLKLTQETDDIVEIKAGKGYAQGIFTQYGIVVGDSASASRTGGFGSTSV